MARVLLAGEFDLDNEAALTDALAEVIADPTVGEVLVDMGDLTFIDSSGLRSVVLAHEAAQDAGKRLALVAPRPGVRRILQIVALTELIDDRGHAAPTDPM